jgi:hypothetical protein
MTYEPIRERFVPVEPDDAFSYIVKAAEIKDHCLLQDCPALNDLRVQLTNPTTNIDSAYERVRQYHRLFNFYHPLHSFGLLIITAAGLTWEKAYDFVSFAGAFIISFGLAYWLLVLFGKQAAAISLILLAYFVSPGQGLQTVVPSNIALGLSFILWAFILESRKKLHWIILLVIPAVLLMHTVGKLYSLMGIIMFVTMTEKPISKQAKIILGAAITMWIIWTAAPIFISRPELVANFSSFFPLKFDYWEALLSSLQGSLEIVNFWFFPFPNYLSVLLLVAIGYFALKPSKKKPALLLGITLTIFLAASLFYIDPFYGALVFDRAWIPVSIFLTGFVALAIWTLSRITVSYARRIGRRFKDLRVKRVATTLFSTVLLILILSRAINHYFPYYTYHYDLTLNNKIERKNFRVYPNQPSIIVEDETLTPSQTIIYMSELSLYYYLSNGGLGYGALYYPALDREQYQGHWFQEKLGNAAYLVGRNPLFDFQADPDMNINLDDNAILSFKGIQALGIDSFTAFVIHDGRPVELEITWHSRNETFLTYEIIPDETNSWVTFNQNQIKAEEVEIKVVGNRSVTVHGLHFDDRTQTNWPWNPGITLTLTPERGDPISVVISNSNLAGSLPINVDVIDDTGITVLAKVMK